MLSTLDLERKNKLEYEYIGEDKMKNTDIWIIGRNGEKDIANRNT